MTTRQYGFNAPTSLGFNADGALSVTGQGQDLGASPSDHPATRWPHGSTRARPGPAVPTGATSS